MRRSIRYVLIIYALVAGLGAVALFTLILLPDQWGQVVERLTTLTDSFWPRMISLAALALLFGVSLLTLVYALLSGKIRSAKARNTEYGIINISSNALENIALNSAKAAQAGIKTAKARVSTDRERRLEVVMSVVLFSDVEIPTQMQKIQERVRKDLERYSGIPVGDVDVRVTRVELMGARVEK